MNSLEIDKFDVDYNSVDGFLKYNFSEGDIFRTYLRVTDFPTSKLILMLKVISHLLVLEELFLEVQV